MLEQTTKRVKHVCVLERDGREPWSSGYAKRLILEVVGLNPSTIYWMDIFSH